MKINKLCVILFSALVSCALTSFAKVEFSVGFISKGRGVASNLDASDAKLFFFKGEILEEEMAIKLLVEEEEKVLPASVQKTPVLPINSFVFEKNEDNITLAKLEGVDQSKYRHAAMTFRVIANCFIFMTRAEGETGKHADLIVRSNELITSKDVGYSDLGEVKHPNFTVHLFADDENFYFMKRKIGLSTCFIGDRVVVNDYVDPIMELSRWEIKDFRRLLNRVIHQEQGLNLTIVNIELN